jgi:hypothetical protein
MKMKNILKIPPETVRICSPRGSPISKFPGDDIRRLWIPGAPFLRRKLGTEHSMSTACILDQCKEHPQFIQGECYQYFSFWISFL